MLKYQAFCVKGHTTKQLTMKTFGYSIFVRKASSVQLRGLDSLRFGKSIS